MVYSKNNLKTLIFLTLSLFILVTFPAYSEQLKTVKPEKVGLSGERLTRIDKVMQKHVDDKIEDYIGFMSVSSLIPAG